VVAENCHMRDLWAVKRVRVSASICGRLVNLFSFLPFPLLDSYRLCFSFLYSFLLSYVHGGECNSSLGVFQVWKFVCSL